MTSATTRRVAKLEGALLPREAVLAWLAEAQQLPSIVDHARSIAELPVEAAPLSVISARVVGAVREARFCLVMILNSRAVEVARFKGVCTAAAIFWMGALLGGPREPPASDHDAKERREAWRTRRTVVDTITSDVRIETEARAGLERRYLAGHDVLFADVPVSGPSTSSWSSGWPVSPRSSHRANPRRPVGGGPTGAGPATRSSRAWKRSPAGSPTTLR